MRDTLFAIGVIFVVTFFILFGVYKFCDSMDTDPLTPTSSVYAKAEDCTIYVVKHKGDRPVYTTICPKSRSSKTHWTHTESNGKTTVVKDDDMETVEK